MRRAFPTTSRCVISSHAIYATKISALLPFPRWSTADLILIHIYVIPDIARAPLLELCIQHVRVACMQSPPQN